MRVIYVMFLAIVLLGNVSFIQAQSIDETIPVCSANEVMIIYDLLEEYMADYANVASDMQDIESTDLDQLLGDALVVQVAWWNDYVPELPRCTLAMDIVQTVGQLTDETLIALLMVEGDYLGHADMYFEHVSQLTGEFHAISTRLYQQPQSGMAISSESSEISVSGNLNTALPIEVELVSQDATLLIESIEFRNNIRGKGPKNGAFLLVFANIQNTSDSNECFTASNMRMILDGQEFRPDGGAMSDVQDTITPFRDYLGPFLGQCIDDSLSAPTYAVFDVPIDVNEVIASFQDTPVTLPITWVR